MIEYLHDQTLFASQADALVNTVNCKGTMGKGIAKEFAKRFPECVWPYKMACKTGQLTPGDVMLVRLDVQPDLFQRRPAVILFATKDHWRAPSRLEWIDRGLRELAAKYRTWHIGSIAMPQLGCGLGGLNWPDVRSLVEEHLSGTNLRVEVYASPSNGRDAAPVKPP